MTSSFHCAIVVGCPAMSTTSFTPLLVPNPCPNKTTLVPIGPLTGSTRTEEINESGTALLTKYSTGAQHDPSGSGSEEASRTTTSPLAALDGITSSILSSFHRLGRTTAPPTITSFTPNMIFGSRAPADMPKLCPVIFSMVPRSASVGVIVSI